MLPYSSNGPEGDRRRAQLLWARELQHPLVISREEAVGDLLPSIRCPALLYGVSAEVSYPLVPHFIEVPVEGASHLRGLASEEKAKAVVDEAPR